ncbi:unnamed protein product [Fusarium venenatum]|uniref:Major facilitator superfamily (MFS) profile domain-containing protein n=1 Tax=Fusarium venenatum TaxID=56646 RepID=A0A2L2TKN7_9HYPO|nr:uncharacterized protein FVRRES_10795 [Fusarium venenatum]CEI70718.1 unnamed protein product [Fusarium venenatum]
MSTTTVTAQANLRREASIELASSNGDGLPDRTYDSVYTRFSNVQKSSMTAFIAFGGLMASMSTTSILAAVPEVAESFHTTPTAINISNAVYLVFVGLSCCFWGPWADVFGRKSVQRGASLGWFAGGCMLGPAFGPLVSGVIVTYTSWRIIFWLQAGLAGIGLVQAIFILHETLQQLRYKELRGKGLYYGMVKLWEWSNPWTVFKLFGQKNLFCVCLASATTAWNMYSLLTPIRFVLNPRLGLTSPLQSGLLYLAPGAGYLLGTQIGGRLADRVVKSWMIRRGFRLQEDRLRAGMLTLGVILPGTTLLYGWSVERSIGGVALPGIYIMQHQSGKASASHYLMRYIFSAVATASCLPLIEAVGVGWTVTVSSAMVWMGSGLILLTIMKGERWRTV